MRRHVATHILDLKDDGDDSVRINVAVAQLLDRIGQDLGPFRLESQTMTTVYRQAGPQVVLCCVGVRLGGGPGGGDSAPTPAPDPASRAALPRLEPSKN